MAQIINEYHICTNACLERSKLLMSAQQLFVALFSCSESWCVRTLRMESKHHDGSSCEVHEQSHIYIYIVHYSRYKKENQIEEACMPVQGHYYACPSQK